MSLTNVFWTSPQKCYTKKVSEADWLFMEETTDERDFEQGKGACGGATEGFPLVTVRTWCG